MVDVITLSEKIQTVGKGVEIRYDKQDKSIIMRFYLVSVDKTKKEPKQDYYGRIDRAKISVDNKLLSLNFYVLDKTATGKKPKKSEKPLNIN